MIKTKLKTLTRAFAYSEKRNKDKVTKLSIYSIFKYLKKLFNFTDRKISASLELTHINLEMKIKKKRNMHNVTNTNLVYIKK